MKYRIGALICFCLPLAVTVPAGATELPAIKTSAQNVVPACVTPGRLMSFVRSRNDALDPRFEKIAVDYMRHGEKLGMRWDFAFVQMLVETGYLSFKRESGRRGDVAARQNNFAGLGATGGVPGESFPDVATGVLAHLQHVMLYAGETIERPAAERTRKVQEWGILKSWQKGVRGPITYAQVARRWANNDDAYGEAIEGHAKRFFDDFCSRPDPSPGLVAEARGTRGSPDTLADAPEQPKAGSGKGAELAKRAIEEGRKDGSRRRSALGAAALAKAAEPPREEDPAAAAEAAKDAPVAPAHPTPGKGEGKARAAAPRAGGAGSAAVTPKLAPQAPVVPAKAGQCRVWTASYGGSRALIIRHQAGQLTNFTVLDVNEGAERREAEAYIAAYARGGSVVQEFGGHTPALERAFELCPEG